MPSLVGSEMCIRDRRGAAAGAGPGQPSEMPLRYSGQRAQLQAQVKLMHRSLLAEALGRLEPPVTWDRLRELLAEFAASALDPLCREAAAAECGFGRGWERAAGAPPGRPAFMAGFRLRAGLAASNRPSTGRVASAPRPAHASSLRSTEHPSACSHEARACDPLARAAAAPIGHSAAAGRRSTTVALCGVSPRVQCSAQGSIAPPEVPASGAPCEPADLPPAPASGPAAVTSHGGPVADGAAQVGNEPPEAQSGARPWFQSSLRPGGLLHYARPPAGRPFAWTAARDCGWRKKGFEDEGTSYEGLCAAAASGRPLCSGCWRRTPPHARAEVRAAFSPHQLPAAARRQSASAPPSRASHSGRQ